MADEFHSPARHGFVRAAVCVPRVELADPAANAARVRELLAGAAEAGAAVVLFPELGLTGYSNQDLFHQDALLDAAEKALEEVRDATRPLGGLVLVGLPVRSEGRLFNGAAVLAGGRLLGVVPKSYLPTYREFYEARHFAAARQAIAPTIRLAGDEVPFGPDLLFVARERPELVVHVEICEDLWVPIPQSSLAALAGATVLCNLSASNITIGKADYRRLLCASQSGRTVAAYLYAAAGQGESTTDLAWDGHAMAWENGELLAESARFARGDQTLLADIDLERLAQDRLRLTSFHDSVGDHRGRLERFRRVPFELGRPAAPDEPARLARPLDRFPYVPADAERRDERCHEAYQIQVHGLVRRLEATGIERLVIGISGGLDSTQALIVCARAMDRLGLPRDRILAYTMPGFATSERTLTNARRLMEAIGASAHEIDIRPSARQMLEDIGHPAAAGEALYDTTFENVQAGERTSHLFRLANRHGALVVGTGDLSELALGWTTYGVGDQMSHYNVNASVPKTLIQHLIRWEAASGRVDEATAAVLADILATEISPELVPATPGDGAREGQADQPVQRSEEVIGPYELQDFFLYFVSRFGFRPSKVAYLALQAWGDAEHGAWPDDIAESDRREYDLAKIKHWLGVFLRRFFQTSQFKRSAMPDGPKVGSGGSLSPRSDWRAPSDASAATWLAELEKNVP